MAGWRQHPDVVQVRHRRLVAGRAEKVGTRWPAATGTAGYLRERDGSRAHKLRWFPSAQDAALAPAQRHQDQWPAPELKLTAADH